MGIRRRREEEEIKIFYHIRTVAYGLIYYIYVAD